MQAIEERVSDQGVLKLLRAMLRAGVMQDGSVRREASGTPQGGAAVSRCCATCICTGWTGCGTAVSTVRWCATATTWW